MLSAYFGSVKKSIADVFMFLASALMFVSILVNHGGAGMAYGGSLLLETITPYLMARVYLRNEIQLVKFAKVYIFVIFVMLIPVLYEAKTGSNLFKSTFGFPGGELPDMRLGFYRAAGPLDHPILFGIFAASGLSLAYALLPKSWIKYAVVLCASFASLSSAAYVMLAMQSVLLAKKKIASARLSTYAFLLAGAYLFIDVFSNRQPLAVLASYLSLDKQTSYFRLLIYENAIKSVESNPFLGIGLNDWTRPDWMPPSIDSFFMVLAVRHGLLTLLCVLLVIYFALKSTYANNQSDLHIAFRVLLFSLIVAVFTVHIWNTMYVFFWLILGIAVNLKYIRPSNKSDHELNSLEQLHHGKIST